MSKYRGADALVSALSQAGVKQVFTLSGNHIMPVFDACLDAGIKLFHTRHEAAAVHMADAWARLTGEVGVAMVTGGPGHANAVSALYTAQMAESAVLLLSGHAPNNQLGMGAFQEMRQADVAAPLVKAASTVAGAGQIASDVAQAMRLARSGRRGPVQLNLPTDALDALCAERAVLDTASFAPPRQVLDPGVAHAMIARLAQAEHPLILTGPACATRAGRQRMAALESASGMPVIAMESPRGIGDPCLGAFAEVLAQADCVLLLNKRLDFTLKFGSTPSFSKTCIFLQVDPDEAEVQRTRRAIGARLAQTARADPFSAIDALVAASAMPASLSRHQPWADEVREAIAYRPAEWISGPAASEGKLRAARVCAALQPLLDSHPDAVFVSDGGEFGQWAQACLHAPDRVINGVAGAIGAALPFAVAARIARPDAPIIAALGDGTFGFHAAEMDTAVRYGLPFVAVVGNDACWNAEYQIQLRDYGSDRLIGCDLLPTRYDRVTEAFGGFGRLVTKEQDVRPAVEDAQRSALPACVNVMIDRVAAPSIRRAGA